MAWTGKSSGTPGRSKLVLVLMIACLLCAGSSAAAAKNARSGVVLDGHARFTVIAPTLIRLEYSKNGKFINLRYYGVRAV